MSMRGGIRAPVGERSSASIDGGGGEELQKDNRVLAGTQCIIHSETGFSGILRHHPAKEDPDRTGKRNQDTNVKKALLVYGQKFAFGGALGND